MSRKLKNYDVQLYFHSSVHVSVKAHNDEEAIELAREYADNDEILNNMQEDDDPDVTEND